MIFRKLVVLYYRGKTWFIILLPLVSIVSTNILMLVFALYYNIFKHKFYFNENRILSANSVPAI